MAVGTDLAGVDSIDYSLSTAPTARIALAQAFLRRLSTKRGALITDPTYGYDLKDQVGASVNETAVAQGVTEQCIAEEEVEDVDVDVNFTAGVLATVITVTDGDGPFDLSITSDELTITALINGSLFWTTTA